VAAYDNFQNFGSQEHVDWVAHAFSHAQSIEQVELYLSCIASHEAGNEQQTKIAFMIKLIGNVLQNHNFTYGSVWV
jgi:hypothetical protein